MTFRPALRPGTAVLRRDAHHLQVGTAPGRVLTDQPGLFALLLSLDGHHDAEALARLVPELTADLPQLLTRLEAAGVAVDGGSWDHNHEDEARHLALSGHDRTSLSRRRGLTVGLHADRGTGSLLEAAGRVLTEAGVRIEAGPEADILVVASVGEPAREPFAEAARRHIPHLVVRAEADTVHFDGKTSE